ncbi:MAG: serine/threonine protein kinase [Pirellulales bacterium]|nr:serine/threonine protein kinase [Pirellulales bacterium]
MNLPGSEQTAPREPRSGANRFAYPSGSRPLEGYTVKRGIGHGGFGEVYYATSDAGKEVAIKLIRRNLNIELRGVMQCLNLKHPNLVALYDVKHDQADDTWVVMEYVAGEQLEDVVARHPHGLPQDQVLAWMHGICAGVAYLHDRGIVHRDLKPGNIFNDEGLVKIGDYGLSKFISSSRRSGQTESVGTVHYMAPEVANGRYGKEIDIYALGIMLYELLTGRVPFEGESVGEVLMKHLTAQPDLSALPEPYRTLVARSLEKDPQQRINSVAEFMAMLPPPPSGMPKIQPTLESTPQPSDPLAHTVAWNGSARANPGAAPQGFAAAAAGAALGGAAAARPAGAQRAVFLPGEPIWTSAREATTRVWNAWNESQLGLLPKLIILFFGVIGVLALSGPLLALMIVFGTFYVLYLIFWLLTAPGAKLFGYTLGPPLGWSRGRSGPPPIPPVSPAGAPAMTAGQPPQPPHATATAQPGGWAQRHAAWHEAQRSAARDAHTQWHARFAGHDQAAVPLVIKPARDRVADLMGSLLFSALAAAAAAGLVFILQPSRFGVEDLASLAIISTLGAWGLLVPAKFWEGTEGEPIMRRLVLFAVGLVVGAAAFGVDTALLVQPRYSAGDSPNLLPNGGIGVFAGPDGQLLLPMYLAYFGFLFLVLRWWKQAEPLREQRLSLWATAVCVGWAALLSNFWQYPQPMGMLVAGTISVAVQLSSPWVDRRASAKAA